MAEAYCDKVKPYFEVIRDHCDKLELLVDNELWTLTENCYLQIVNEQS
jgi:glutamine synthetase